VFKTKLRALKRLSLTQKQKVLVLDDSGQIDLGFCQISLYKGSENEVPLWLAKELERLGKAKVNRPSLEDLGRLLFQEKQNVNVPASILKLDKDFYLLSKFLERELKGSNSLEDLEKLKRYYSVMKELSTIRLRKIIQLALLNINEQNLISRMSREEYLVYQTVSEIIKNYYGEIVGNSS
jgi:DNA replication factor GINS